MTSVAEIEVVSIGSVTKLSAGASMHSIKGEIVAIHVAADEGVRISKLIISETNEPAQVILHLRNKVIRDEWFYPSVERCDVDGNPTGAWGLFTVSDHLLAQAKSEDAGMIRITIVYRG